MLEVIRAVSGWLGNATYGIGPCLALVPLDGSDTRPSTPTIVEETTTGWVARGEIPEGVSGPTLSVALMEPIDFGEPSKEAATARLTFGWDAVIGVRYHVRGKASDQGSQDAYYVLRAARGCLQLLDQPISAAVSARVRGGVRVERVSSIRLDPPADAPGDAFVVAGLTVTLRCHDTTLYDA